jgi:hypothetical protein
MDRTHRQDPREAEDLRMARARRALVEHELSERRFDLFQRKAWFWILAATTVAFAVLTIVFVLQRPSELAPIAASGLTSLAAGAGLAARARSAPRDG